MSKPVRKKPKMSRIDFRLPERDKKRIQWIADEYAEGNLSKWIIFAALNADLKYVK